MGKQLARIRVLTPQAQAIIVECLKEGNYLTTACTMAGLDSDTFYYWRKRFEAGDSEASEYADFFGEVKRASAFAEVMALRDMRAGGFGWQASACFLERRFPKRWGRKPEAKPKAITEDAQAVEAEAAAKLLSAASELAERPKPEPE